MGILTWTIIGAIIVIVINFYIIGLNVLKLILNDADKLSSEISIYKFNDNSFMIQNRNITNILSKYQKLIGKGNQSVSNKKIKVIRFLKLFRGLYDQTQVSISKIEKNLNKLIGEYTTWIKLISEEKFDFIIKVTSIDKDSIDNYISNQKTYTKIIDELRSLIQSIQKFIPILDLSDLILLQKQINHSIEIFTATKENEERDMKQLLEMFIENVISDIKTSLDLWQTIIDLEVDLITTDIRNKFGSLELLEPLEYMIEETYLLNFYNYRQKYKEFIIKFDRRKTILLNINYMKEKLDELLILEQNYLYNVFFDELLSSSKALNAIINDGRLQRIISDMNDRHIPYINKIREVINIIEPKINHRLKSIAKYRENLVDLVDIKRTQDAIRDEKYVFHSLGFKNYDNFQKKLNNLETDWYDEDMLSYYIHLLVFENNNNIRYKLGSILAYIKFDHVDLSRKIFEDVVNYYEFDFLCDDIALFGLAVLDNSIDYIRKLVKNIQKHKYYDMNFVTVAFQTYWEMIGKYNYKEILNQNLYIKDTSDSKTSVQGNYLILQNYIKLGRIYEGIQTLKNINVEELNEDERINFHKLHIILHEMDGDYEKCKNHIEQLIVYDQYNHEYYQLKLIKIMIKFSKFVDARNYLCNIFDNNIVTMIEKILPRYEQDPKVRIDRIKKDTRSKIHTVVSFLDYEHQEKVPTLTRDIQNCLLEIPNEFHDNEINDLLGYSYYYEGLSYELILEELERINSMYSLSKRYFELSENEEAILELNLKLIEMNYFNINELQYRTAINIKNSNLKSFNENTNLMNMKSKKNNILVEETKNLIFRSENKDQKIYFNLLMSDDEDFKDKLSLKFNLFMYLSKIDRFELRSLLKSIRSDNKLAIDEAIDIVYTLIRRFRPKKGVKMFNFNQVVSDIRQSRINNLVLNYLKTNIQVYSVFMTLNEHYPKNMKLSYIELLSLNILLAYPYVVHRRKYSIEDISLRYEELILEIKNTSIEKINNYVRSISIELLICLIYSADILRVFGGVDL